MTAREGGSESQSRDPGPGEEDHREWEGLTVDLRPNLIDLMPNLIDLRSS